MAGPLSPFSLNIVDSEEFAEHFIQQAFLRHRQRTVARSSRWSWPFSSLEPSSKVTSPTPLSPLADFTPANFSPGVSPTVSAITLFDADQLSEVSSPFTELPSPVNGEVLVGENPSEETPDHHESSQWAWPISERSSASDTPNPIVLSPSDEFFEVGSSLEASSSEAIVIWETDLLPEEPWNSSRERGSSQPAVMHMPPTTQCSSFLDADHDSDVSAGSEAIVIWESDLLSGLSPTPSPDFPPVHRSVPSSSTSFGGFTFLDSSPTMEHFSFDEQEQATVSSPSIPACPTEGLSFNDKGRVKDYFTALEGQCAESSEAGREEGPLLVPSAPDRTPRETQALTFVKPDSDTSDLLDCVSERLAHVELPSPVTVSPLSPAQITQAQPSSGTASPLKPVAAPPKKQRPQLTIITNFSPNCSRGSSPDLLVTAKEESQSPYRSPSPVSKGSEVRSIRFAAGSSGASGQQKAAYPKETFPKSQKPKFVRFVDRPSRLNKRVKFAHVPRRRALIHAAAERFKYPKTPHPLSGFLKSLAAPADIKPEQRASVIHPLLKPAQVKHSKEHLKSQPHTKVSRTNTVASTAVTTSKPAREQNAKKHLKSRPQTQVSFAVAVGKAAVTVLSIAGLYFALQR